MHARGADASTSTDDELQARPLCLFYFSHPFAVLSPELPTLLAPGSALLAMRPASPLHFWSSSSATYDTASASSSTRVSFDLGNAKVHKNPVNVVSVTKTRKCTVDLGTAGQSLASTVMSGDFWFSSSSSSRSFECARRLAPYHRILPPLRLPLPQDSSFSPSSDDTWPKKCLNPAKRSLPPIEMPVPNAELVASACGEACVPAGGRRARRGMPRPRARRRATHRSGVRRLITCLINRAVKGRRHGSASSGALRDLLALTRRAWPSPASLFDSSGMRRARAQPAGAAPGLPRRRYSVPETVMRKYRLAQQRSETEESAAVTTASGGSVTPGRGACECCESCGSCGSLCEWGGRRAGARRSALLRRVWGVAGAEGACRSLGGSRAELRPASASASASPRCSHAAPTAPTAPTAGWASPKRLRLDSFRDFRGSDEMLKAAMRNSYDKAEGSRFEKSLKVDFSESTTYRSRDDSPYEEKTTDQDSAQNNSLDLSGPDVYTEYSERRVSNGAAVAEVSSDLYALESENSALHAQIEDNSFSTDTSDTLTTTMSTTKEATRSVMDRSVKPTSNSAHIDGRISERSMSVENDDNNIMPYDKPLSIETPAYDLLEIVVSESSNSVQSVKNNQPERSQITKLPFGKGKNQQNINIDEYVSNILVESLNSLTDQLEYMNASIGSDRKINIVEKEIKVKLQNTGVNTIVHLSPTSNNQIIFGNEELYINDESKDNTNASAAIREEMVSVQASNVPRADPVNHAVLQQIQKLFQDEFHNLDSDLQYPMSSIPGISHIEISNVDVFIDNNCDPNLKSADTTEVRTENNAGISELLSGVGTGNYYKDAENNAIIPRFSAFPHTDSMEVNTSSSDDAEIVGSDCASLVDSLDDPNSPRSLLLRRAYNNNNLNQKRSELVRSAIDVLDLLPENTKDDHEMHREKGEAFYIRIKDDDCDCEKENVVVADHMPEKIKQRLYRRHRKRELRLESAGRRRLQRDCLALADRLVDDLVADLVRDEYKCMRIKQKPNGVTVSKSDENLSKRPVKKDNEYFYSKQSCKRNQNSISSQDVKKDSGKEKRKSERHIRGKLSLLTHPNLSPEERGPKRIYQKSEIHDGNKCIEILEILEYVNGSQSSPETTNSDENHNHNLKGKKSRIPVPVHERAQKNLKYYIKEKYNSIEDISSSREMNKQASSQLSTMLMNAMSSERQVDPSSRRASLPPQEPRSRSNSLRFRRVFDSIPEEKGSLSIDSSNEDVNHNRRASAPNLVDNLNYRCGKRNDYLRYDKSIPDEARDLKNVGTSPLKSGDTESPAQGLRSKMTMTSPRHRSTATSPNLASAKLDNLSKACVKDERNDHISVECSTPKKHSVEKWSGPRRWLGLRQPGQKEHSVELDRGTTRSSTATQYDEGSDSRRRVRTVFAGGGHRRGNDDSKQKESHVKKTKKLESKKTTGKSEGGNTSGHKTADIFRKLDKRKTHTKSVDQSEEESSRWAGAPESGSSDSGDSGGALCPLAPRWLRPRPRPRPPRHPRRPRPAPRTPPPPPPPHPAPAPLAPRPAPAEHNRDAPGWSVTVAGSSRAALPADLEMRLRFPRDAAPRSPPHRECACESCFRRQCQCACACALPAAPAAHPAPPAHADRGKLTLTMKKEALDSSILASKSVKKSSEPLPDLETYRASRTRTKSSMKTRRGYSLHCWLPEDEPPPVRSNGLSVLGCAIIPELKPRVPTMSERDLTRAYTPRHYLRS